MAKRGIARQGSRERTRTVRRLLLPALVLTGVAAWPASGEPQKFEHAPRSKGEIERTLREIRKAPTPRSFAKTSAEALHYLNACRYLAGAPHDVALDEALERKAQAACELLAELGHTSHDPPNPGWPPERYEEAYAGAKHSNLWGVLPQPMPTYAVVQSSMYDTGQKNIWDLGHRRWCLNLRMLRTGFGNYGGVQAMWAADVSRQVIPRFEFLAWPPVGYCPVEYLAYPSDEEVWPLVWSVHVHPDQFEVDVHVRPSVSMWAISKEPPSGAAKFVRWRERLGLTDILELVGVSRLERTASRLAGLAWMPKSIHVRKGDRFWVEIRGFRRPETGEERLIRYYVEGY